MHTSFVKSMIVVSISKMQDNVCIKFEKERYYSRHMRRIYTEFFLDSCDQSLLLRDNKFKEALGFSLCLSFFCKNCDEYTKISNDAQLIYPHFRTKAPVLRIDEEVYHPKSSREYCGSLIMPNKSKDAIYNDEIFKLTLAEKVLKYLPINEKLCMEKDKDAVPNSPETCVPLTTHSYL